MVNYLETDDQLSAIVTKVYWHNLYVHVVQWLFGAMALFYLGRGGGGGLTTVEPPQISQAPILQIHDADG